MIQLNHRAKASDENRKRSKAGLIKLLDRNELGFHQLPHQHDIWNVSVEVAKQLSERFNKLVVVGMGGSALGGQCLVDSCGDSKKIDFLFNSSPEYVEKVLSIQRNPDSHYLVISKSGNTLEVACLLNILLQKIENMKGDYIANVRKYVTVITDPISNPLMEWADSVGVKRVNHPLNVGGRFSVLSPVGLLPASFSGVNLSELRRGSLWMLENHELVTEFAAQYLDSFARNESISAFWSYIENWKSFSPWLIQLWSESLGKNGQGHLKVQASTPVCYHGNGDQHSVLQQLMEGAKDKMTCFFRDKACESKGAILKPNLGLENFNFVHNLTLGKVYTQQALATEEALARVGRSVISMEVDSFGEKELGAMIMLFELTVGVIGEALNINAFDQPGVELGKKIAKEKLQ